MAANWSKQLWTRTLRVSVRGLSPSLSSKITADQTSFSAVSSGPGGSWSHRCQVLVRRWHCQRSEFAAWLSSPLSRKQMWKINYFLENKPKTKNKLKLQRLLTIISASGTAASSTLLSWRLCISRTIPRLWAKSPSTELRCSSSTVTSRDITGSRTWAPASFSAWNPE